MGLLPLDEVRRRLKIVGQSYLGVREIPLESIVGSVDRSADFDRDFKTRRTRSRLAALRAAFPDGDMPAIEAYEVGGLYFISDGHHRVSLARERGAAFIDAEITRLHTNYELPPDVDVARLVHTEQQRVLLEQSGLARSRPDAARIEFARPRGYPECLESIKAHGYDLARAGDGTLPPAEKVAADWYDNVYLPGVAAVDRAGLRELFPFKTEADLFLWIYERRRDLRVLDADADFDAAAAYAAREGVGRRDRRVIEQEKAKPLQP
jgi:hypothetical protein